ncbi:hypothetical protein, partial [Streptococcus pneumoniae]|uniref:hypothetical protein n=1 Tax=Streptococcus pneumoniae TaxID=1313 RepID=UPI0012D7BBC9
MIEVRDANNAIIQIDNPTQTKQQELIDAIVLLNSKLDALQTELNQKLESGGSVNVGNFPSPISGFNLEVTQL